MHITFPLMDYNFLILFKYDIYFTFTKNINIMYLNSAGNVDSYNASRHCLKPCVTSRTRLAFIL